MEPIDSILLEGQPPRSVVGWVRWFLHPQFVVLVRLQECIIVVRDGRSIFIHIRVNVDFFNGVEVFGPGLVGA